MSTPSPNRYSQLLIAANTPYQERTPPAHKSLSAFLQKYLPTLTPKALKLITFYMEVLSGPKMLTKDEYSSGSIVLKITNFSSNP